jgi:hypothetical protein
MQARFILGCLVALLSSISSAQVPATDLAKPPAAEIRERIGILPDTRFSFALR